jgi:hypothetical protein
MTKEEQRKFWDRKIKMGRTTVANRAHLLAGTLNNAIERGNEAVMISCAVEFVQQFSQCWESGDAKFFRELAHCIEHRAHVLTPLQRWLHERLFKANDPEKQTEYLTGEKILDELRQTSWNKLSMRRLQDQMKRIGAKFRNSKKRKA